MRGFPSLVHLVQASGALWVALGRFIRASLRARTALVAENLFLRKQLARSRERQVKVRRASDATRLGMVLLARCFAWKGALTIVQPATLIRWHRKGFKVCGRWRSASRGRPRVPTDLRTLIGRMAEENPTWGQRRIAVELRLKLGLRMSSRTVRRPMPKGTGGGKGRPSQRWRTFVRNHAHALLACDFCVAMTVTFRVLYVFVVLEVGSRRLGPGNVTSQPTAAWTVQRVREVRAAGHPSRFVLHDREGVYAAGCDAALRAMGVRVLHTPVRVPQATAVCERLIGTLRRECLDVLIPLTEDHLRRILREWVRHSNRGRPQTSLGPAVPEPPPGLPAPRLIGHRLPTHSRVVAHPILGGLHHAYGLEKVAA